MGEDPKKVPAPRDETLVDDAAKNAGLSPELTTRAKEAFSGKQALADLRQEVAGKTNVPPAQLRAVNSTILRAEVSAATAELKRKVLATYHDFEGSDFSESATEANLPFLECLQKFGEFCNGDTSLWPPEFYREWVNLVSDRFSTDIRTLPPKTWKRTYGHAEVEAFFKKMADVKQGGLGGFETWFEAKHKKEFDEWQKSQGEIVEAEKKEANKAVEDKKGPIRERTLSLVQKFGALPEKIREGLPEAERKEITDLPEKIGASDGTNLKPFEDACVKWEPRVTAVETLMKEAKDKGVGENLSTPIIIAVLKGEKTAEQASPEIEKLKPAPVAQGSPGRQRLAEEDSETVDKLIESIDDLPDEGDGFLDKFLGTIKKALKPLVGVLAALTARLAQSSIGKYYEKYTGHSFRDSFISSELLAKQGDTRAVSAVEGKRLLRGELGLNGEVMSKIKQITVKNFLTTFAKNKESYTKDPEQVGKLTRLAKALGEKAQESKALMDIPVPEVVGMLGADGKPLIGSLKAETSPPTPPAAEGAKTDTAKPVPAAPGQTPPLESLPIQQQYAAKIGENLAPFQGKPPFDLTAGKFEFQFPYVDGTKLGATPCSIHGNTFEIGGHKFTVRLPLSANLQSISINGPIETGTAKIVAGKLGVAQTREIPLKGLLTTLETLRTKTSDYATKLGSDSVTFSYVS